MATVLTNRGKEIIVHRAATGKVEDYGVVSAYHSNPIRNAIAQLGIWLRGLRRKHGNKGM